VHGVPEARMGLRRVRPPTRRRFTYCKLSRRNVNWHFCNSLAAARLSPAVRFWRRPRSRQSVVPPARVFSYRPLPGSTPSTRVASPPRSSAVEFFHQ